MSSTTDREVFQAAVQEFEDSQSDPNIRSYKLLYDAIRPYLLTAARNGKTNYRVEIDTTKPELEADAYFGGFLNWVGNKKALLCGIMKVDKKRWFRPRVYTLEFDWAL